MAQRGHKRPKGTLATGTWKLEHKSGKPSASVCGLGQVGTKSSAHATTVGQPVAFELCAQPASVGPAQSDTTQPAVDVQGTRMQSSKKKEFYHRKGSFAILQPKNTMSQVTRRKSFQLCKTMTHWATPPVGPHESNKHAATALLYQDPCFDLGLLQDQVHHKYTRKFRCASS